MRDCLGKGCRVSALACLWLLPVIAAAGCGRAKVPIVPGSSEGRRALDLMMEAWKAGRAPGMLDVKAPQIQVVDSFRKDGQALRGYTVLSEVADERTRTFTVRLDLAGPDERPMVRYLLVGIDPILVFRDRDYELLTHFEHKMDEDEATAPRPETK